MLRALDVAKWIVHFSNDHGDPVTNLKLQKLLYYAQAWHLVERGAPLFEERIEAWVHGPAVYSVWRYFKPFRYKPIELEEAPPELDAGTVEYIKEVLDVFGGFSTYQLERMTHNEAPWKEARRDLPPESPCRKAISLDSMEKYYRALQEA